MNRTFTRRFLASALVALAGTLALAQQPRVNVGAGRHPNMNAAQRLVKQAFERMSAAQRANEFDMKGHAAKAKELLEQADHEITLAAETANAAHAH